MKLRNRLPFFLRLLNKIRTLFGIPPLTLTNAKAGNLLGLTAYGGLEQNGTPTPDNPIPLICNNGEIKVDSNGNVYCDGLQETLRIVESNSTATAEMLLKLGDYVDSQDILRGIVNRQLGIKVFDGSEVARIPYDFYIKSDACDAWFTLSSLYTTSAYQAIGICSHLKLAKVNIWSTVGYPNTFTFNYSAPSKQVHLNFAHELIGTTASSTIDEATAAIKNYITQQYNNGTPIIVVYPLATPTETSVTPQPLTAVEGNNTLEIQQASLNNLEVEVTYKEK